MAVLEQELDDNLQTYEEFRIQVDRDLGIHPDGNVNDSSRKTGWLKIQLKLQNQIPITQNNSFFNENI